MLRARLCRIDPIYWMIPVVLFIMIVGQSLHCHPWSFCAISVSLGGCRRSLSSSWSLARFPCLVPPRYTPNICWVLQVTLQRLQLKLISSLTITLDLIVGDETVAGACVVAVDVSDAGADVGARDDSGLVSNMIRQLPLLRESAGFDTMVFQAETFPLVVGNSVSNSPIVGESFVAGLISAASSSIFVIASASFDVIFSRSSGASRTRLE